MSSYVSQQGKVKRWIAENMELLEGAIYAIRRNVHMADEDHDENALTDIQGAMRTLIHRSQTIGRRKREQVAKVR